MIEIHIGEWCVIRESRLTEEERINHCENTLICYDCEYNSYHEEEE